MELKNILDQYKINYSMYGNDMAKVDIMNKKKGKIILVTATNPTKYGEGKTTVAIGLNDAFKKLGYNSIASLREPSMGPVFGVKGGATGGGKAVIVPEDKINLHFTGDFHAITSANNLICALIDNHIYQGNELDIQNVTFNRCLDMNDRALRNITIKDKRYEREEIFNITAASEIMGVFCLAKDMDDLRSRISDIIIGYNSKNEEIYVKDLKCVEAVIALLLDAMKSNAVKSLEDNLVLVHGGPFANIAHGCSSLISLNTARSISDYVITEAGFGSDAGATKFLDILSRNNFDEIYATVLITTIRALKLNGDGELEKGISNLQAHIDILKAFNVNVVVTLNKFEDDTDDEIKFVQEYVEKQNIKFAINEVYLKGSIGGIDLANKILEFEDNSKINYLYDLNDKLEDKINKYLSNIGCIKYNASDEVKEKIKEFNKYKYPICVAKTQYSISDDPKKLGYPKDYEVTIRDIKVNNGSKFIVIYLGDIITMPGLSKNPSALEIKIENDVIYLPR